MQYSVTVTCEHFFMVSWMPGKYSHNAIRDKWKKKQQEEVEWRIGRLGELKNGNLMFQQLLEMEKKWRCKGLGFCYVFKRKWDWLSILRFMNPYFIFETKRYSLLLKQMIMHLRKHKKIKTRRRKINLKSNLKTISIPLISSLTLS